jgi:hypothetical protein
VGQIPRFARRRTPRSSPSFAAGSRSRARERLRPVLLCDRWSSGGPAEETAEWMAVARARSASQPGVGAESSTPTRGNLLGRGFSVPLPASGRNPLPPLVLRCSSGLSGSGVPLHAAH